MDIFVEGDLKYRISSMLYVVGRELEIIYNLKQLCVLVYEKLYMSFLVDHFL
jgi:hypothetical protein